jgi:hypothetical protein
MVSIDDALASAGIEDCVCRKRIAAMSGVAQDAYEVVAGTGPHSDRHGVSASKS